MNDLQVLARAILRLMERDRWLTTTKEYKELRQMADRGQPTQNAYSQPSSEGP